MDDPWWSSWVATVVPYAVLLRLFIDGQMSGEDFEILFLPLYKNDPTLWSMELFGVLDGFFADVDDFVPDPGLRAEVGGIDEAELRHRADMTFRRLAEHAA